MCITFHFYHLCGHIHKVATFPCAYTPTPLKLQPLLENEVAFSTLPSAYRPVTCLSDPADSLEEIRLFPTLCANCERAGIISEWLDCTPDGRFDVIRAWNKTHRPESRKQALLDSETAQLENLDHINGGVGSDATAAESDKTAVTDRHSPDILVDSPPRTKLASRSHKTSADISPLHERMAALTTRLKERIADLKK